MAETRDVPYEVIIIDNGSTDETVRALRQLDGVRVHANDANLGFARACNQGAALARGRYTWSSSTTTPSPGRAGCRAWWRWRTATRRSRSRAASSCSPTGRSRAPACSCGVRFSVPADRRPAPVPQAGGRGPAERRRARGDRRLPAGARRRVRRRRRLRRGLHQRLRGRRSLPAPGRAGSGAPPDRLRRRERRDPPRGGHRRPFQERGGEPGTPAGQAPRQAGPDPLRLRLPPPRPRGAARRAPRRRQRVVVAEDALATIVPCVENLVRTLRADDELLLVDAGSRGASARILETLAARHAGPTRLLLAAGGGFAGAARAGIAAATAELVAVLGANVKVGAGWLDKLIAHLSRDPGVAALSPSWSRGADRGRCGAALRAARGLPDARRVGPGQAGHPGPRTARVPSSGCLLARREVMRALAEDTGGAARRPADGDRPAPRAGLGRAGFGGRRLRQEAGPGGRRSPRPRSRPLPGAAVPFRAAAGQRDRPIRDNLALTRACVDSVHRCSPPGVQLVLVDNGSSEDVAGFAAELQRAGRSVVYRRNAANEGFAFACNQGLAAARGEILVLLNNDVEVTPGWLERPIALLELDPAIALCGPATNATSGPQLCGTATYRGVAEAGRFTKWARDHAGELAIVPRITGLCMVMRRGLIDRIGGFDTAFGFGNCEDDDFCVRVMRAGHKIAIAYDAFIHHHGSATFKALELDVRALCDENWEVFCAKWGHPVFDARARGLDALAALGRAAPFDAAADRIPVDYAEIFNRRAAPLDLDTRKRVRVLCIPDWRAPAAWRPALERFFATFSAADPVALVVRVEPPTPANAERAARAVSALLQERGIAPSDAPDIVIEATPLPRAPRLAVSRRRPPISPAAARATTSPARRWRAASAIAELPQEQEQTQGEAQARGQTQTQVSAGAPAVSVIVPTRNRPELLEVALRSVLAQTMQDFEAIVVVNDAGVPITGVVQRLGAGGKIRCLENATNRGHGGARNAALRIARRRYVAYLDDDDSYHPDHLATLLGALAGGTYQVAYSDAVRAHMGGGAGRRRDDRRRARRPVLDRLRPRRDPAQQLHPHPVRPARAGVRRRGAAVR